MTRAMIAAVLLLSGALAACDESTSGAAREAARSRFDTDTSGTGGGGSGDDSSNECGAVTALGVCEGAVLSFCDDESLISVDCRLFGSCGCGRDSETGVHDCFCDVPGAGGAAGTGGTAGTGGAGGAAGTAGSAGTGGESGSGGSAGSAPALADAIARGVEVECQRLASCSNTMLEFWFGGLSGCRTQTRETLEWLSALTDSGVTTQYLAACYDAVEVATCDSYFSAVPLESCIAYGTRKNGEACVHSAQCESGYCPSDDFSCQACEAWPSQGSVCEEAIDCPRGMTCTTTGVCALPAGRGEPCSAAKPCDFYLTCNEVCDALPATLGAACGSATGFPQCDERAGLACSSDTSGTCLPLVPTGTGASCAFDGSNVRFCRSLGTCTNGSCVAGPSTGQTCDAAMGLYCAFTEACVDGRCTAVPNPTLCDG